LRLFGCLRFRDWRLLVDGPLDHRRAVRLDRCFGSLDSSLRRLGSSPAAPTTPAAAPGTFARLFGSGFGVDGSFSSLFGDGLLGRFQGDGLAGFDRLTALATAAATAATTTATAAALPLALGLRVAAFSLFLFLVDLCGFGLELFLFLDRRDLRLGRSYRPRARAVDGHPCAFKALVDQHFDADAVPLLDVAELGALLVEDVDRGFLARAQADSLAATACCFVFQNA
jgi:hypothetical protein